MPSIINGINNIINKFTKIAISDAEDFSHLERVKELFSQGVVDAFEDDVLSELDANRQNYLLNSIGDIQTIITCTGLDEFVENRFNIDNVYKVVEGTVERSQNGKQ